MTNTRKSLIAGLLGAGLLCGAAQAQGLYDNDYANSMGGSSYDNSPSAYSNRQPFYNDTDESVTVQAPRHAIQKQQILGRYNGEVNPVRYTASAVVAFNDLDLSRATDRQMLHDRIIGTARNVCGQLSDASPVPSDQDERQECVRNASINAMHDAGIG
jgi:UrcA family protein